MGRSKPHTAGFKLRKGKDGPDLQIPGSGAIYSSQSYREMRTAKAWGLNPDQWYDCTREARASMIALDIGESVIAEALAPPPPV